MDISIYIYIYIKWEILTVNIALEQAELIISWKKNV
jgi:hypothetical protein